jgi:hypothetical protein
MRKDAQERRARLIAVAADMFEQQGYDVPLETIAERAAIGRGMLASFATICPWTILGGSPRCFRPSRWTFRPKRGMASCRARFGC